MATIVRTERHKRGVFGWIFLVLFWVFNALMALSLFVGVSGNSSEIENMTDSAQQAGYAAGTAIGVGILIIVWAAGTIILGLFVLLTRGKKVIVETVQE